MILSKTVSKKYHTLKCLKHFISKYNIPIIITLIYIAFFSLWHLKNNYLINFDSSRYYTLISHVSLLLKNTPNFSIQKYLYYINTSSSLWISILSLFTYILHIELINKIAILNNIFSIIFFIFTMHFLICKNTTKKIADISLILICLSPIFFNLQKVLLPEVFSFTITALSLNSLINIIYKKGYMNEVKYIILSYLSYISNPSSLIITIPALLVVLCFYFKKFQRILFFIIILFLSLYIIIPEKIAYLMTIILTPDISGSWEYAENYSLSLFLKNFIWQIYGFLNHTLSITTVIFFIITYKLKNTQQDNKKQSINMPLISAIYIIVILILLAWIRPLTAHDFYATGYRYQIPLFIIFSINFSYLLTLIKKKHKLLILSLYIFISSLTIIFQSIPSKWNKGILFSLKVLPSNKLCNILNLNGNITIFNGLNNIVSGGGQSKFSLESPTEMKAAQAVIDNIGDKKDQTTPWITIISKLESFHHNINTLATQNKLKWIIQGDQKNPFISKELLSNLKDIKIYIPQYKNMKNSIIQLLESNFIVILSDNSHAETETINIYKNLLYIFKSNKKRFELIKAIKIKDKKISIYKNRIILRQNNFLEPLNKPSITFGIYEQNQSSLITKDNDIYKILTHNNFKIKKYDNFSLENALLNNLIETLIIPDFSTLPFSLYDELLIFYQRGGNLWFTGPYINQKQFHKKNTAQLSFLYDLFGFEFYQTTSNPEAIIKTKLRLKKTYSKKHLSLIVKNGMKNINFRPVKGNFFPHRTPASNSFALAKGFNNADELISTPLSFHTFYNNSYKENLCSKILFNGIPNLEQNFINQTLYIDFIKNSAENFTYPLIIEELTPSSIIITKQNKNNLNLTLKIKNTSQKKYYENLIIFLNNKKILSEKKTILPGISTVNFSISSKLLKEQFLLFSIKTTENIYQEKSCLVINNQNNINNKNIPPILINKNKFNISGKTFISGTNYYPSSNYDLFWNKPDLAELYHDFKDMKKMGLQMVRMHYIHPKWYLDVNKKLFRNRIPLKPSKFKSIKILKSILYIARHFNIYLCFDIFSLIGEDMGTCSGWTSDLTRFTKIEYINNQNIFLIDFLKNLKEFKNFSIDLINEPEISSHNIPLFKEWVNNKINIIKEIRPDILVTVGFKYPGINLKRIDYSSVHLSHIKPAPKRTHPVIIQELWNTPYIKIKDPYKTKNYSKQKDFPLYNKSCDLNKFLSLKQNAINKEYAGLLPWCYRSPSTLYNNQGLEEQWENSLGFFKRSDGSKKN